MRTRLRSLAPAVLLVLGTVVAVLAAVAIWLDRLVLDTPTWTATSTELLADPAISVPLSQALADRLDAQIGFEQQAAAALPDRASGLAPIVGRAVHDVVEGTAERIVGGDRFQEVWRRVNRRAHGDLVRVLDGRAPSQVDDGSVILDLRPLMAEVAARAGLPPERLTDLPPEAGRVVLLGPDKLDRAQRVAGLLDAAATWLGLIALLLLAAAVWLATDRRRHLGRAGCAAIVAAVILFAVRRLLGGYLPDAVADDEQGAAVVRVAYDIVTDGLVVAATTILVIGLVTVVAAWIAGPRDAAARARAFVGPLIADPRHAFGGLALVALALIAWGPTSAVRSPLAVVILGGALTLGLELLRRQTARESSSAAPPG
jgi:hypothetical protein